ncbi:MAG: hypothetical protein IJ193_07425 [Bacilli bacterium]|nr:hypothetical protein [Bacilli bacterium]
MYIGLVETCSDYALANILEIVQNIMTIFQIVVPIVSIVALIKLLILKMSDPENKKLAHGFRNWIVLLLTFFLLPVIIDAVMGAAATANDKEGEFTFASCWNYARYGKTPPRTTGTYIKPDEESGRTKVIE